MSEYRGYLSPLGGEAVGGPPPSGGGPIKNIEPGTPGYNDLLATFRALKIDRPETKDEMVTAVKNILAGKNRTYNESMAADMPTGTAMQRQQGRMPSLAPPPVLYDFLHYVRDLPENIYHGFQDALGDRLNKTVQQIGTKAYERLDPQYRDFTPADPFPRTLLNR